MRISGYLDSKGLVCGVAVILGLATFSAQAETLTTQITVASDGTAANGSVVWDQQPGISADGRVIVFSSDATNLDDLADNGFDDVYVHFWDDAEKRSTQRISVGHDAEGNPVPGNGDSNHARVSADGRMVVFSSAASNMVENDNNNASDVFVYDRENGTIRRVSLPDTSMLDEEANGRSGGGVISADGKYVAFVSDADNLVADSLDASRNVYLHHIESGETRYIGPHPEGSFSVDDFWFVLDVGDTLAISGSGSQIAYYYRAGISSNDRVRYYDVEQDVTTTIPCPDCSGNIMVRRDTVSMSSDGRYVVFATYHGINGSIGIVYLYDHQSGEVRAVATGGYDGQHSYDQGSIRPQISADGRYLVYTAYSDEYDDDGHHTQDGLVFVEDLKTGNTQCVSVTDSGIPWYSYSWNNALSADGAYVVFGSMSRYLVEDGNWRYDLYRHDRANGLGCTTPLTRDDGGSTVIIIDESVGTDGATDSTSTTGGGGGALGLVGLLGLTMLLLRRRLYIGV